MKKELPKIEGVVVHIDGGGYYRVEIGEEDRKCIIRCVASGKIRMNSIKIVLGDRVSLVLPPKSDIGRIMYRA